MDIVCSCKKIDCIKPIFSQCGKKNEVFFRKVRQRSTHSTGMVRGKRFCRSCKRCKIRPTALGLFCFFFSKCICHLLGCFLSPLFCSHPHLCETRVTSLKLFCFRYFHFSVWSSDFLSLHFAFVYFFTPIYKVLLSFLFQLHWRFSQPAIAMKEKKRNKIALLMLNLQLHFGVRWFLTGQNCVLFCPSKKLQAIFWSLLEHEAFWGDPQPPLILQLSIYQHVAAYKALRSACRVNSCLFHTLSSFVGSSFLGGAPIFNISSFSF